MATFDLIQNKPSTMAKRAKSTTDASSLRKPAMIGQRSQSIAANTNNGMKVTPWGVALRPQTTKPRRNTSPVNQNNHIAKRRSTLRKTTKDLAKCLPKKTNSRKFKLQAKPFALHKEPLFGVMLRSVTSEKSKEDEEQSREDPNFLDLQLKNASHRSKVTKSSDAQQDGSNMNGLKPVTPQESTADPANDNPFGVRLKPVRTKYNRPKRAGSTFQIDLNPSSNRLGGRYVPESKNFLEIRLRPVKRTAKQIRENKPEFIELQLRHVVAPVDGGPKRAVTQASFHIPLMKHINLEDLRRQSISLAQAKAKDPLGDLLQLQIQNLKHCEAKIPNQGEEDDTQLLKINLRHVCPNTNEVTQMAQNIHVELKPTEYETTQPSAAKTTPKRRSSWNVPPSMAVAVNDNSLKPTDGDEEASDASTEEPKVHIKQDVHVVHEEEESPDVIKEEDGKEMQDNSSSSHSHSHSEEYDEEEVSDYEEEVLEDSDYEEEVLEDGKPKRGRFKNKGPRRAGSAPAKPTSAYDEDFFEIEEEIEEYEPLPLKPAAGTNKRMTMPNMNMEKTMGQVRDEYEEEEQALLAQDEADKKKKKKKRFRKKKKQTGSDDEYEYFEEFSDSEYEDVSGDESDGEYEEYEVTDSESESEYEEIEVEEEDPVTGEKTRTRRRVKREKPVKRNHGTPPSDADESEYEEIEVIEEDPVTGKKRRFRRRIKRETPVNRTDGTPPSADDESDYEEIEVIEEDPVTGKKRRFRRRIKRETPVDRTDGTPPSADDESEYEEIEVIEEDPVTGKKRRFRRRIKRETPVDRTDGTPPSADDESEYEEIEIIEEDPVTGKKRRFRRRIKRETPIKKTDGTPPTNTEALSEEEQDPETTPEKAGKKKEASHLVKEEPESEKPAIEERDTKTAKPQQGGNAAITTTNGRRTRPRNRPATQKKVPRSRSRSLTELDRLKTRRDTYVANQENKPKEEKPKVDLTLQKRRDLLMWYNRMKCPNKDEMKRRVAKLPADCDITPADVDLLPWLMRGRFLDLKVMNSFFMENWQGKEGSKK